MFVSVQNNFDICRPFNFTLQDAGVVAQGFGKEQAETIVSALITLSNVSLDTVYKDMVTQTQQEITLQQIMAHLDSIRKDMVILEKSEFANLRAENESQNNMIIIVTK
ncbi:coiled-coil domain-containing protein mitochondrial isoform x2 [Limosa lapponica baueri]|uniref:Coiled-coil domain-containing protein mitochondrial isoform x2 n=1 Tax=Limosa lapponica baueri TaxID=1758121 RepID=A0A2I0TCQ3_LIMLA|nr:coiled-coil domain-containing protein mitochondrial isoform x2 [Limosa lapponica baueri]